VPHGDLGDLGQFVLRLAEAVFDVRDVFASIYLRMLTNAKVMTHNWKLVEVG